MNMLLVSSLRWLDRYRALLPLLLAVMAGLLAAWAAQRHLDEQVRRLESERSQPVVERLVAAYDLPEGALLVASHLAVRQLPLDAVSSDSLEPLHFEAVLGRRLRQALRAGDALLPAHLTSPAPLALSRQLPAGRRAVTLPADAIHAATGLLMPGDHIDLYVSFPHGHRRLTMPLMQDVRVLSAGARVSDADGAGLVRQAGEETITLEASPDEAVKLVAARQGGQLTAVLRPASVDGAMADPQAGGAEALARGDLASLLGLPEPAAPLREVEVLYGNAAATRPPVSAGRDGWPWEGGPASSPLSPAEAAGREASRSRP